MVFADRFGQVWAGTIGVTHPRPGVYNLTFPSGFGDYVYFQARPVVQQGSRCDWSGNLNSAGTTLFCFDPSGNLADTGFMAFVAG